MNGPKLTKGHEGRQAHWSQISSELCLGKYYTPTKYIINHFFKYPIFNLAS